MSSQEQYYHQMQSQVNNGNHIGNPPNNAAEREQWEKAKAQIEREQAERNKQHGR